MDSLCNKYVSEGNEGRDAWMEDVKHIFSDMCKGIQQLHRVGNVEETEYHTAHRDVSLENTIIDKVSDTVTKHLAMDFAMSRDVVGMGNLPEKCGKLAYAAPEVDSRNVGGYDAMASDIWALGTSLYALVTGSHLFALDGNASEFDVNRLELLRELGGFLGLRECGELHLHIDDATAEFIDFMLIYDWQERPNIQEVLSHDWFN